MTIGEYINYKTLDNTIDFVYFFIDYDVSINKSIEYIIVYFLKRKDLIYNDKQKELKLNISNYCNKKIECLLEELFITDDMLFDLMDALKKENVKFILINEKANQDDLFFKTIYDFFKKIKFQPVYQGVWK